MLSLHDTQIKALLKNKNLPTFLTIVVIFIIFLFVSTYNLGSFPALVGDEGYEGLSVIDHLKNDKPFVFGRESYVSYWSDYTRLPFVQWLGPTALAMRIPLVVASIVTFWLAWIVLKRLFSDYLALFTMVFLFFSPQYTLSQRISWPIFFLPLLFFLLLFFLTGNSRYKSLFSGLVAGLGVATHMVFIAPLSGIVFIYIVSQRRKFKEFLSWWPALVGFFAGFGMQLNILSTFRVESSRVGSFFNIGARVKDLFLTLLYYFSGSANIGEYIGEFSENWTRIILVFIFTLAILALILKPARRKTWLWLGGILITIIITTFIANYFRSRYLHIATICFWGLAGLGLGKLLLIITKNKIIIAILPIVIAIVFSTWTFIFVYRPYTATAGTAKFFPDSGASWDTAGHFSGIEPLINCVIKTKATVYAPEPKILNRLLFFHYNNKKIGAVQTIKKAPWVIGYRSGPDVTDKTLRRKDELCPELDNYIVTPNSSYTAPTPTTQTP
jgi:hypothetical protein